jgi:HAD superfamily hydrolase (TIGR01484 family)
VGIRCVYTDLDGTMLGKGASLLRDAEGNFTLRAVRALEACHRRGVEVVILSGRRRAQVHEGARLIGQRACIYELGCALVDGPEEVFLTGSWDADGERTVHRQIEDSGAPDLLLREFAGRLEVHSPWNTDRRFSHLFRGEVDLDEVHALLAARGHDDLRLVDNGLSEEASPSLRVERVRTYHLIPRAAGKANAVAVHMRRRGLSPQECIAIGDARGDLEVAEVVGRFFLVANAAKKDPSILSAATAGNVVVTEEAMTHGFYEAIVRSLAEG